MSKEVGVVAIDGPAGSGKSVVAKLVAKKLGDALYIDTGSIYRAIGYYCHNKGIAFENESEVANALKEIELVYGAGPDRLIEINGENLTQTIREHYVSELASKISKIGIVRDFLLDFQRELPRNKTCTMEGRDIGTVIFPDAFCKIFLVASAEIRARRRYDELIAKGQKSTDYQQVLSDLKERDYRDANREIAPLKQADDAILLDTSDLSIDQVVAKIVECVEEKTEKNKNDIQK